MTTACLVLAMRVTERNTITCGKGSNMEVTLLHPFCATALRTPVLSLIKQRYYICTAIAVPRRIKTTPVHVGVLPIEGCKRVR